MQTLIFPAFESPWPAYSGAQKRTLGLLTELARGYVIDLHLLVRRPLSDNQQRFLRAHSRQITEIPRRDDSWADRTRVAALALARGIPYHLAVVEYSLQCAGKQIAQLQPADTVFSNLIHWTWPIRHHSGPAWIVDQHNADVHFWHLYRKETRNGFRQAVAAVNGHLTLNHCRQVYPNVGGIISVSEQDRALTLGICPAARVEVIENGVDCDEFRPDPTVPRQPRLLFTGTSAQRNMKALDRFVADVLPRVQASRPDTELIIGGNFLPKAQAHFSGVRGVRFTGPVADLRPYYHQCAVFINPFEDAYGSKLKVSEALAMGICIVSLPGGVRGMPVRDGESVLIAQDAAEMADQIVEVLGRPGFGKRIGLAGRDIAEKYLDWRRVLGPRLRRVVSEILKHTSAR